MKLSSIFIYCNSLLMSAGSGLEPGKPEKMTDRHFSHPLSVALATLIGTAGTVFQYPPPILTQTHTHTARHKDKEGKGGRCKEKNYGAPCHPLGKEIHHNRFLMASVCCPPPSLQKSQSSHRKGGNLSSSDKSNY